LNYRLSVARVGVTQQSVSTNSKIIRWSFFHVVLEKNYE
jgi:hypothetical protein